MAKEDGLWCFDAPFNNISVSFIGGENWSTRKKPLTCRKSLKLYHIMLYRVHLRKNCYRKCNFSSEIKICRKIILSEQVRTIVTNFCEKGYSISIYFVIIHIYIFICLLNTFQRVLFHFSWYNIGIVYSVYFCFLKLCVKKKTFLIYVFVF